MPVSTIRATTEDDLQALPEIERSAGDAFRAYEDLSWLADGEIMPVAEHRRLHELGTSWVAEIASDSAPPQLIGFLCAETFASNKKLELHIWELAVHAGAQGAGAGTALMRHVMAYSAADTLVHSVTLTTFRHVAFNAPFYAKLGFEVVDDLSEEPRLKNVLAAEAAHGLPIEDRCAMRLWC